MKKVIWIIALLLLTGRGAAAQESQVPLDLAGRVEAVDATLARRLGLFAEYPGFVEARLFQAADSSFVLEVTTRRDGRLVRDRRPLSATEARTLRERVSALVTERAPSVGLNQEGRNLLLGQTALLGVFFYGPAMATIVDAQGSAELGTYMLTAGASFFLPFALTQKEPVTYGMAHLSRYGATRGTLHGAMLYTLAAGEDDGADDDRALLTSMVATSVAEGVAGYRWARSQQMSAGHAATIVTAGDGGLLWGAMSAVALEVEDARLGSALMLAGSGAGIYAGSRFAARRDFTWGDASLLYTSGLLGAYGGLSLASLADEELSEPQLPALAVMAGSALGALAGDRMLRGKDFTVAQSSLVQLGTIAGGLSGVGVAAMTDTDSEAAFLTLSALGAVGGFALTYNALAGQAANRTGESLTSLKVNVTPAALFSSALSGGQREPRRPMPLATVEYRF